MSISYGMEKRFNYESNNATKPTCYKMLKKNNKLGCAGQISMKSCCMLAVAVIIVGMAGPSQALPNIHHRFFIHKRSEEPQSTLIAFPRVGRSVSDNDYHMIDDQNEETRESNGLITSNVPSIRFNKKSRLHTRSSKGSMMAFPRVGKRSSSPTDKFAKVLSAQGRDYGQGQWSDDQGFKEAVRNNDLYQFLHSMLKEIAKSQHQNGLVDLGE